MGARHRRCRLHRPQRRLQAQARFLRKLPRSALVKRAQASSSSATDNGDPRLGITARQIVRLVSSNTLLPALPAALQPCPGPPPAFLIKSILTLLA